MTGLRDVGLRTPEESLFVGRSNRGGPVGVRIVPEHPDRPGVRETEALDALDGRGLAGSVGTEDAEDLTLVDGEAHATDGSFGAVARVEVDDLDGCY